MSYKRLASIEDTHGRLPHPPVQRHAWRLGANGNAATPTLRDRRAVSVPHSSITPLCVEM
jgi:hypothetical protein